MMQYFQGSQLDHIDNYYFFTWTSFSLRYESHRCVFFFTEKAGGKRWISLFQCSAEIRAGAATYVCKYVESRLGDGKLL